jgi:hypothetical protein
MKSERRLIEKDKLLARRDAENLERKGEAINLRAIIKKDGRCAILMTTNQLRYVRGQCLETT